MLYLQCPEPCRSLPSAGSRKFFSARPHCRDEGPSLTGALLPRLSIPSGFLLSRTHHPHYGNHTSVQHSQMFCIYMCVVCQECNAPRCCVKCSATVTFWNCKSTGVSKIVAKGMHDHSAPPRIRPAPSVLKNQLLQDIRSGVGSMTSNTRRVELGPCLYDGS